MSTFDFVTVLPGDETRLQTTREVLEGYRRELNADLCLQGYQEELDGLPGKYSPPTGTLLLVESEGIAVACGAIRDLGDGICELKRIYVHPSARRNGLARQISLRLLETAQELGYAKARLDTLSRLPGAVELYENLGFNFIDPYNDTVAPDIVYMEKVLN